MADRFEEAFNQFRTELREDRIKNLGEALNEINEMKEIEERMKNCSHSNMDLEDGCPDCGYNSK